MLDKPLKKKGTINSSKNQFLLVVKMTNIIIDVGNFGNRTQIAKTRVGHAIHYTTDNSVEIGKFFEYILQLLSKIACIFALHASVCLIDTFIL